MDDVILVDTDEICAAIKDVFEDTRSILEPAGALAIAGAKAYVERTGVRGTKLVAVACGANTNFDRLRFVAERAEVGEHREAILAVTIPERPGSFKAFCATLGARNITEFNYRIADPTRGARLRRRRGAGPRRDRAHREDPRASRPEDARSVGQRDGEAARAAHGGRARAAHAATGGRRSVRDELLYRFEFPERPGALMKFLNTMRTDWNISLFHYRNHGADYGRVLVGMQVPRVEMRQFRHFLATLGYPYVDESRNPAYQVFLG